MQLSFTFSVCNPLCYATIKQIPQIIQQGLFGVCGDTDEISRGLQFVTEISHGLNSSSGATFIPVSAI